MELDVVLRDLGVVDPDVVVARAPDEDLLFLVGALALDDRVDAGLARGHGRPAELGRVLRHRRSRRSLGRHAAREHVVHDLDRHEEGGLLLLEEGCPIELHPRE